MLWQKKKKRKKTTKPKAVTQTVPQHPVEEIPQTTKSEKKEEMPMYFSNVWVLRRIFGGH